MGEATNYAFSYQEIVEALIKKQDIHEGVWGIYIEFGIKGANIGTKPGAKDFAPVAIVPVLKIGIQRFNEENNLTVDASKVNPIKIS